MSAVQVSAVVVGLLCALVGFGAAQPAPTPPPPTLPQPSDAQPVTVAPRPAPRLGRNFPLLGIGAGPLWRLGESPVPPPASQPASVTEPAVEVWVGWMHGIGVRSELLRPRYVMLIPQIGYSYAATTVLPTHLFSAGLGAGYGTMLVSFAYTPRLVLGRALGEAAVGVRHGVSVYFLSGVLFIELAHQWLHFSDSGQNDLRLTFNVNVFAVVASTFLIRSH